jgi:hypothetical protein
LEQGRREKDENSVEGTCGRKNDILTNFLRAISDVIITVANISLAA